ncbi:MAG TPA: histidine kinase N-terminal 7TM domain-containing protein [Bacillota bacterium]|nr:histidine kinase N-terminal 7TM domain-containing protein [Bacillota bacterium]
MHDVVTKPIFVLLTLIVFAMVIFVITMYRKGNVRLVHKVYFVLSALTAIWLLAIMSLIFIRDDNQTGVWIVDSITNLGGFIPVLVLLIAFIFIYEWNKLPRWTFLLFVIPCITQLMVWTNPLHHFFYQNEFVSLNAADMIPGWYFYIHSVYTSVCTVLASFLVLKFAFTNKSKLYIRQAILFATGNMIPLIVNAICLGGPIPGFESTIVTTPLSYVIGVVLLHGLAIFKFHMLDIKPMAVQTVLNKLSDGYLVLSDDSIAVSFNKAFAETFGKEYKIKENVKLSDLRTKDVGGTNMGLHTLLNSIESCRQSQSTISYEQAIVILVSEKFIKKYYMVDVTPLLNGQLIIGFVVFFKDVTKLKESMQKLQQSQAQMMERDRLASLGQMVGGIAHNLKTPIMGISGSASSINVLIDESEASIGDNEVTPDDYREIYEEMRSWTKRIVEACAYMSDIITAVKGQATTMNSVSVADFAVDDLYKRVSILLRHELKQGNCTLVYRSTMDTDILIHGDLNSMVQVVNNLVTNAIDAMRNTQGGNIIIDVSVNETHLLIKVIDHGTGIPDNVKKLLFKQMVTNKGAVGTGLGIFMSYSSIKANFGGTMWFEDNPEGGTIFGISIPLDTVSIGQSIYTSETTQSNDPEGDTSHEEE